jgi:hypothetical protein
MYVRLTEMGTCCPEGTVEQLNRISLNPWFLSLPSLLSSFEPFPAEALPRIKRSHRAETNGTAFTFVIVVAPIAKRMMAKCFDAISLGCNASAVVC